MANRQLTLPGEIVKKSNALARGKWAPKSVYEPRLVALVASRVRKTDDDFSTYEIPLAEILGSATDGRTYRLISEVVDNLMGRVVTIEDDKGWTKYALFSKCRYDADSGCIKARFDPDLKPHYLGLQKQFTKYSLMEFMMLPSTYSQRLFEILRSWDDKPEATIQLSDLHEMLDTTDSLRTKYTNFKARVLASAHKDINRHTGLLYEWEPIKKGRKITAIRFVFSKPRKAETKKAKDRKSVV